jgi:hypothetical protein
MKVCGLRPGKRARPDPVETSDDAPSGQIATVGEQRPFAGAWREDPKQRWDGIMTAGTPGACSSPGLLADAAVDPLAEQIGVAEMAGVFLDHVE